MGTMSDYTAWVIGGLTPVFIINDPKIDPLTRTITINCLAKTTLSTGTDPRLEIQRFQDIASERINNAERENGGTYLSVDPTGHIISVTDGTTTWSRCALRRIPIEYDGFSKDGIPFTLIIEYEESVPGGFTIYTPDPPTGYHKYTNIEFYEWYYDSGGGVWVKANAATSSGAYGTEIGWMKITEARAIKAVTFYGSACTLPASIYVPGSIEGSRPWIYSHDDNTNQPFQEQRFTFDPATAPTEIEAYSDGHNGDDPNHGAWLQWVRVEFL